MRFAHKTFAVDHAIKNAETDYVLWLDADTYTFRPISKDFVNNIKKQAVGEKLLKSVKPGDLVVKIVRDNLVKLLGQD